MHNLADGSAYNNSKGVHNFSHPRTDGVVIMAIIDETGENILLGRNVRHLRCN